MSAPYEVIAVEYLGGHRLRLGFADGLVGDVDLTDLLGDDPGPMLAPLVDTRYFAAVVVDPGLGTIVWPNGADLAPDALHQRVRSAA